MDAIDWLEIDTQLDEGKQKRGGADAGVFECVGEREVTGYGGVRFCHMAELGVILAGRNNQTVTCI